MAKPWNQLSVDEKLEWLRVRIEQVNDAVSKNAAAGNALVAQFNASRAALGEED